MLRTPRLHPNCAPEVVKAKLQASAPEIAANLSDEFYIAWQEVSPGVIESRGFNLTHAMDEPDMVPPYRLNFLAPLTPAEDARDTSWHARDFRGPYGVADNIEQVLERYADLVADPDRVYCFSYTIVRRDEQPSRGGWRFHKWGEYIGTHDVQYEYLADEKGIDSVICFHIYQLEGEFFDEIGFAMAGPDSKTREKHTYGKPMRKETA